MNNKFKNTLSTLLVTGIFLSSSSTIFASQNNNVDQKIIQSQTNTKITLTKTEKKELLDWLTTNGVDKNTQNNLFDKLDQGIIWDSLTNATPVETIKLTDGSNKYVYADGSVAISNMDFSSATNKTSKNSEIINAAVTNTVVYTNVKIAHTNGFVTCSFYADYTIVAGGRDHIDGVNNFSIFCVGCTHSGANLTINRPLETASYHAQASLTFGVTVVGGLGSQTCNLSLYCGDDLAYKQWN